MTPATCSRRYGAMERVGEEIRKTNDALATGERLLQYMTTLTTGGQMTPERLLDDAEAILGLSEWAAEVGHWKRLLELVKTVQAAFEIAHRVEELLALLECGRSAARALDDWRSEVWMLRRLAAATVGRHTVSTYTTVTLPVETVRSTKTITRTVTAPRKTVTETAPGKTTTVTERVSTVTGPTSTVTGPVSTVTTTEPAKTVTAATPAKTVTVTTPAKPIIVPPPS